MIIKSEDFPLWKDVDEKLQADQRSSKNVLDEKFWDQQHPAAKGDVLSEIPKKELSEIEGIIPAEYCSSTSSYDEIMLFGYDSEP